MSTHIAGFRPPDAEWAKMKAVWDACEAASVEAPLEVQKFFGYDVPNDAGVSVDIESGPAVKLYREEMKDGYEIDLTKLPADLKIIRVYNSY